METMYNFGNFGFPIMKEPRQYPENGAFKGTTGTRRSHTYQDEIAKLKKQKKRRAKKGYK